MRGLLSSILTGALSLDSSFIWTRGLSSILTSSLIYSLTIGFYFFSFRYKANDFFGISVVGAAPILLRTPEFGTPIISLGLLSCILLLTPPPILEPVGLWIALLEVDLEVAVGLMYDG